MKRLTRKRSTWQVAGAKDWAKYSAGNWATGGGFDHSRLYGALQRHLTAYWSGEDIDAESGNCHLDHAACMLAFLITHRERHVGKDDRWVVGAAQRTTIDAVKRRV